ncbi:Adaptive-response sensory-kinase SasA [Neolewinella maritima]|uniref:histidine kinase n=2 Tax=Neolewinella maritima TaxID=1383882 RepID=A0ABM9B4S2_9BACT|nr:Adaptive-response sensory-kinase SasA [Neolewinella maritima]
MAGSLLMGQATFQFGHIPTSDDYSLNPVMDIDQDARGQIWLATRSGLLRHNGRDLRKFNVEHTDSLRRAANVITALRVTSAGTIWLATRAGIYVHHPALARSSRTADTVRTAAQAIREIGDEVWVGTGNTLVGFDTEREQLRWRIEDCPVGRIQSITPGKGREVWVAGTQGVAQYTVDDIPVLSAVHSVPAPVHCMLDYAGSWWLGTSRGVYRFDPATGQFDYVSKGVATTESEYITSLTVDDEDRLWIGTYAGLFLYKGDTYTQLRHQSAREHSLADDKVGTLFTDRTGMVWIGSYFGGLNTWNRHDFKFARIGESNGNRLHNNVVSAIVEGEGGEVYFGTASNGFTIYEAGADRYTHVEQLDDGRQIGTIRCMLYQDPEHLWIGTFQQGLIEYNPRSGRTVRYVDGPLTGEEDLGKAIMSLALRGPDLLVGTMNGSLRRFDTDRRSFADLPAAAVGDTLGTGEAVRELLVINGDSTLIGTSWGVYLLRGDVTGDGRAGLQAIASSAHPDPRLFIEDMVSHRGRLWVATIDKGLYELVAGTLRPHPIPDVRTVYTIVPAATGELWLSTDSGLVRYSTERGRADRFGRQDGVAPNAFQRSAGVRARDGTLYFGGASGVTVFDPAKLGTPDTYAPRVVLSELRLFNKAVQPGDPTALLTQDIDYTERIELDYDQNRITLGFVMPTFVRNPTIVYRYRLLGQTDEWTETQDGSASFLLQEGRDYTFEVTAHNSDGTLAETTTSLDIRTGRAPWRSYWAYAGYALLLGALSWWAVRMYRSRSTLRRRIASERRERRLQRRINKAQEEFFTNISHELRTPLTLIAGNLERSLKQYRGSSQVYRQLIAAKRSSDRMRRLINDLLRFKRIGNDSEPLRATEQDLTTFLRTVVKSFRTEAEYRHIELTLHAPETDCTLYFEAAKLERAVYNLISNAVKQTPDGGRISISVTMRSTTVDIAVQDTGPGIPVAEQAYIFDRYYRADRPDAARPVSDSSGMGLAIAREAVEQHGGSLEVLSVPGEGSTFVISLPRHKDHLSQQQLVPREQQPVGESAEEASTRPVSTVDHARLEYLGNTHEQLILLVEDNREVSELLRQALSEHFRVRQAFDGAEGLRLARLLRPHLIVSDVMLPQLSGVELCGELARQSRTAHIPILLLTADASEPRRLSALLAGAVAYLVKPVSIHELIIRCQTILGLCGAQPEAELEGAPIPPDEVLTRRAMQMLNEQVGNVQFQLPHLMEALNVSRSVLFAKFKEQTGLTPNAYLLQARMKQAAILLESQHYNASEVAYRVGYATPSYFSRSFKKHFGVPPSTYAKQFAADSEASID